MITHLACIMDGNRRWARQQGWLSSDGHREGVRAAQRVVDFCLKEGISYLSLYTFSIENFKRSEQEKNFLFNILIQELKNDFVQKLTKKNVRLLFVGDRSLFPQNVKDECNEIERMTAQGTALQVNLLFGYGGQQEIIDGVKKVAHKVADGNLALDQITSDTFARELWTAGTPAPDLIIRTGGAHRLSNFLLFQAAYSELFFLDCFWPEIDHDHLDKIVTKYTEIQRNFGS